MSYERAEAEYLEPPTDEDDGIILDTIEELRDALYQAQEDVIYWQLKYKRIKSDYEELLARCRNR